MIVKVCGLCDAANIRKVEALGVDWMGFIFYPHSPRNVHSKPSYLPEHAKKAGVFVNATEEFIKQKVSEYGLDIVQLHGHETPNFCRNLKSSLPEQTRIMKSIPIEKMEDIKGCEDYENATDYILLETRCSTYGGSGRQFDWNLLQYYKSARPFILSGGIRPEDVQTIKQLQHPNFLGIDLNSRFEISPGVKNIEVLESFLRELRG